jgi:ubiquinone biosynthesis protein
MPLGHGPALLGRYRRIADVLGRHGLAYVVGLLGLERFLLGHPRAAGPPTPAHTPPEHVRMALEELGATFVKLGQILSTRPDLVTADYEAELARLRDHALPVPTEAIRAVLVAELGRPIEEAFASFDDEPFAAASIGQAHAATLPDGTEVVVKVRRLGVVAQVEEDLEILQNLAATAGRRWALADRYDPVGLAQQFARSLRAELDYLTEGRNAERFAASYAGDPAIQIPRVFHTSPHDAVHMFAPDLASVYPAADV